MSTILLEGDCLKMLPGLATESIDLVFTSPPYPGVNKKNTKHIDYR